MIRLLAPVQNVRHAHQIASQVGRAKTKHAAVLAVSRPNTSTLHRHTYQARLAPTPRRPFPTIAARQLPPLPSIICKTPLNQAIGLDTTINRRWPIWSGVWARTSRLQGGNAAAPHHRHSNGTVDGKTPASQAIQTPAQIVSADVAKLLPAGTFTVQFRRHKPGNEETIAPTQHPSRETSSTEVPNTDAESVGFLDYIFHLPTHLHYFIHESMYVFAIPIILHQLGLIYLQEQKGKISTSWYWTAIATNFVVCIAGMMSYLICYNSKAGAVIFGIIAAGILYILPEIIFGGILMS